MAVRSHLLWIGIAGVIGLTLRVGFAAAYWVDKPLTHDEREYLALARGLTEGRGFTYGASAQGEPAQRFGRAPAYPAFLALIGAGTAEHASAPLRVKVAQSLIGALTVFLIGIIASHCVGPRAGVAAALLAAVYPPLVWIGSYVLSESLYTPVALLTAYTLHRGLVPRSGARRQHDLVLGLASGALAGIAMLIRPAIIVFVLLAIGYLLARRRRRLTVAFVMALTIVVAPWTIRNARVHGRFILVASEGGVTFWTGNHPLARGDGDLAANPELKLADLAFRQAHPGLTPEELEPLYYRSALQWIAANPGRWLRLVALKAFYTIVPIGPSYTLHSTRYRAASIASYGLVLPFALVGLRRLWRSPERPTAILLLGASAVLVGLVFFPQERFRIPVIDPVLILAAATALAAFTDARDARGAIA